MAAVDSFDTKKSFFFFSRSAVEGEGQRYHALCERKHYRRWPQAALSPFQKNREGPESQRGVSAEITVFNIRTEMWENGLQLWFAVFCRIRLLRLLTFYVTIHFQPIYTLWIYGWCKHYASEPCFCMEIYFSHTGEKRSHKIITLTHVDTHWIIWIIRFNFFHVILHPLAHV